MVDIVERLRICAKYDPDQAEAADKIERLREALRYYAEKKQEDWVNVSGVDDGVIARAALKESE